MNHPYDDLLDLPHHRSTAYPPMPVSSRAAQFSSFAALTGHEAAVRETARLTMRSVELAEDQQELLDRKLQQLAELLPDHPELTLTYFVPDERKAGGSYRTHSGKLKRLDLLNRNLLFTDGTTVPIGRIFDLSSPHLQQPE